jgi:hypothetical protein
VPAFAEASARHFSSLAKKNGRGGEIRTRDLYVPNVALYQAKLRPDKNGSSRQNDESKNFRPAWNRRKMQAGLGFTSKEKTKLSHVLLPDGIHRHLDDGDPGLRRHGEAS